jgi:hypothetical protein
MTQQTYSIEAYVDLEIQGFVAGDEVVISTTGDVWIYYIGGSTIGRATPETPISFSFNDGEDGIQIWENSGSGSDVTIAINESAPEPDPEPDPEPEPDPDPEPEPDPEPDPDPTPDPVPGVGIGKIYFARVASPSVAFDPASHAAEDLTVFKASVSQARQECAIISLECLYPEGGLLSDRWGILSIERGGVAVEIARGQINGFPAAFAGQRVQVELICRRTDHVTAVDELFAARDAEVPDVLVDSNVMRRTEAYLLDEVYHDKLTLTPTLEPIAGAEAPALTLYGEGAAAGQSQIMGIDIEITDAPVEAVTIDLECFFEELAPSEGFFVEPR